MSAPVDVVAVIDRLNEVVYEELNGTDGDLTKDGLISKGEAARDAVVELIGALEGMVEECKYTVMEASALDRAVNALARAKGSNT